MTESSAIAFHQGEALHQVAGKYPTLMMVVLETVQNAIDAEASKIWISLNHRTRQVTVRDNGKGVTKYQFETALQSICSSIKEAGKLGRFGIGLISPLGKCERFTFTSSPKRGGRDYRRWRFESERIRGQRTLQAIPCEELRSYVLNGKLTRKEMKSGGRRFVEISWVTEMVIEGFTKDRQLSRVDLSDLGAQILDRFSTAMRKKSVKIIASVTDTEGKTAEETVIARRFTGTPLPEVTYQTEDSGDVLFRLFLAPQQKKGPRKGRITMGEIGDDYRFPYTNYDRSMRDVTPEEVRQALLSGIFEGEILAEKAKLRTSRNSFERDDASIGVAICLETWFNEVGANHVADIEEARRDERLQRLGLESLRTLEGMWRDSEFSQILEDALAKIKQGTIGKGHADLPEGQVVGKQEKKSLSTAGNPTETKGAKAEPTDRKRQEPEAEKEKHRPGTVAGPRGKRRTRVKRSSFGLQIVHILMETDSRAYELDSNEGVLYISIRHPYWRKCEVSDRAIRQYQEYLAIHALTVFVQPEEWQDHTRMAMEDLLKQQVYLIANSQSFTGGRRKKK